jgi:hypothetical protein
MAGVLYVGDSVADDILEEDFEHTAGLLVDEPGDALDAAPQRASLRIASLVMSWMLSWRTLQWRYVGDLEVGFFW